MTTSMQDRIEHALRRTAEGMSRKDIARELGVKPATISGYLKKDRTRRCRERWPREAVLQRVRDWFERYGRAPSDEEWCRWGPRVETVDGEGRRVIMLPDAVSLTIDGEEWPSFYAVDASFPWRRSAAGEILNPVAVAAEEAGIEAYELPDIPTGGRCVMAFGLAAEPPLSAEAFDELVDWVRGEAERWEGLAFEIAADPETQQLVFDVEASLDGLEWWQFALSSLLSQLERRWHESLRRTQRFAQVVG